MLRSRLLYARQAENLAGLAARAPVQGVAPRDHAWRTRIFSHVKFTSMSEDLCPHRPPERLGFEIVIRGPRLSGARPLLCRLDMSLTVQSLRKVAGPTRQVAEVLHALQLRAELAQDPRRRHRVAR
jgi:hypothetical protein